MIFMIFTIIDTDSPLSKYPHFEIREQISLLLIINKRYIFTVAHCVNNKYP